jgi:hypothetical protein
MVQKVNVAGMAAQLQKVGDAARAVDVQAAAAAAKAATPPQTAQEPPKPAGGVK